MMISIAISGILVDRGGRGLPDICTSVFGISAPAVEGISDHPRRAGCVSGRGKLRMRRRHNGLLRSPPRQYQRPSPWHASGEK